MGSLRSVLKSRIAGILCSPLVGKVARIAFHEEIPNRGCIIGTDQSRVAPETVASLIWGLYEKAEIRLVKRYLPANLDVVDLGASIGVVSSHAARKMRPGGRLVSVEANPHLLGLLGANVHRNAPAIRHEVVGGAISYGVLPTVEFSIAARNIDSGLATASSVGEVSAVPSISLGKLLDDRGFEDYALISDIEGAEAQLLKHDGAALRSCRLAVIELHDTVLDGKSLSVADLRVQFVGLGFRLVESAGPVCVFVRD